MRSYYLSDTIIRFLDFNRDELISQCIVLLVLKVLP